MSTWCCTQCTYSNHGERRSCEMCEWNLSGESDINPAFSASHNGDDCAYITCECCSFHNKLSAESCEMCGTVMSQAFSEVHKPSQLDSRVVTCSRCHVSFPAIVNEKKSGSRQSNNCPNCGDGLNPGLKKKHSWSDDKDFHCELITCGIIELVRDNIEKIDYSIHSCAPSKKITTEYAVCSPCPHISQNGAEGHDWSCGYRNIQMICYSLLSQSTAHNDFKSRLFNGQGNDVVKYTDPLNYLH